MPRGPAEGEIAPVPIPPALSARRAADEAGGLVVAELRPEVEHQHRVAPRGRKLPRCQGVSVNRRQPGLEKALRMGVEGGDDRRSALVEGALDRAADHRLMATVEAVEIAQRDDRAAERFGYRRGEAQALHRIGA